MPGIKSVTITVEFNDGSTEVATIEHPREATITNRDNRSPQEFDPYRAHIPEPPSFDVDLAMKDASGIVWRAHPAPDLSFTGPGYEAHPGHDHEDCCK